MINFCGHTSNAAAAAAAKSLQLCPTLCDPIDGSPPGSPVPEILQARTLEWVAISFSSSNRILNTATLICPSLKIMSPGNKLGYLKKTSLAKDIGFPGGTVVRNVPANAGDAQDVGSFLGWEDPQEEQMATHSSILAWRIPWPEPDRLESMRSQRVEHRLSYTHAHKTSLSF